MKLAVISDEVSQDWATLLQFCQDFSWNGVPVGIELRSVTVDGDEYKNPFYLPRSVAGTLSIQARDAGVPVVGLALPFLKCDWNDEEAIKGHLDGFRHSIDRAEILGCKLLRGFAFWGIDDPVAAAEARIKAATIYGEYILPDAKEAGVTIVMENEASTTLATAELTASFVRQFDDPNLRIVWDPANEVYAADGIVPFPDAWKLVEPYVAHVHAKDAVPTPENDAQTCEFGTGVIDWPGQLHALVEMGYDGCISLETHWRIREEQLDKRITDQPGGAAFSADGEPASRVCMANLIRMLEEAQA